MSIENTIAEEGIATPSRLTTEKGDIPLEVPLQIASASSEIRAVLTGNDHLKRNTELIDGILAHVLRHLEDAPFEYPRGSIVLHTLRYYFTEYVREIRTAARENIQHLAQASLADLQRIFSSLKPIDYAGDVFRTKVCHEIHEKLIDGILRILNAARDLGEVSLTQDDPTLFEEDKLDALSKKTVRLAGGQVPPQLTWPSLRNICETQAPLRFVVREVTKGGLIGKLGPARVFLPLSELSPHRKMDEAAAALQEKYLRKNIGNELTVNIIEVDQSNRTIKVSEKKTMANAHLHELEQLQIGDERTGTVIRIRPPGLVVAFDNMSGFVHRSELDWQDVRDASAYSKVGDEIRVKVIGINLAKLRLSLSVRALKPNPWTGIAERMRTGQKLAVRILRIDEYGAYVKIDHEDVVGFIHRSELTENPVIKPEDLLRSGERMEAVILELDEERRKLELSLRQARSQDPSNTWKDTMLRYPAGKKVTARIVAFEKNGVQAVLSDGTEGFALLSELSAKKIGHPAKAVSINQPVDMLVIGHHEQQRRVMLSLKRLGDFSERLAEQFPAGQAIRGTILKQNHTESHVLVQLDQDFVGFLPIAELPSGNAGDKRKIRAGSLIDVYIVRITNKKRRILLTTRPHRRTADQPQAPDGLDKRISDVQMETASATHELASEAAPIRSDDTVRSSLVIGASVECRETVEAESQALADGGSDLLLALRARGTESPADCAALVLQIVHHALSAIEPGTSNLKTELFAAIEREIRSCLGDEHPTYAELFSSMIEGAGIFAETRPEGEAMALRLGAILEQAATAEDFFRLFEIPIQQDQAGDPDERCADILVSGEQEPASAKVPIENGVNENTHGIRHPSSENDETSHDARQAAYGVHAKDERQEGEPVSPPLLNAVPHDQEIRATSQSAQVPEELSEAERQEIFHDATYLTEALRIAVTGRLLLSFHRQLPQPAPVPALTYERYGQFFRRMRTIIDRLLLVVREAFDTRAVEDWRNVERIVLDQVQVAQRTARGALDNMSEKGEVAPQIVAAVEEFEAPFNVTDLAELRLLQLQEDIPGLTLDADHFVSQEQEAQPVITVTFEQPTETNIWSQVTEEQRKYVDSIAPFRWSWTDEELFAEQKLPQVLQLVHSEQAIERFWADAEMQMKDGFKEWRRQCLLQLPRGGYLGGSGRTLPLEKGLQEAEAAFKAQLPSRKELLLQCFTSSQWRSDQLLIGVRDNLKTFCQIPGGPEPVFIDAALQEFYDRSIAGEIVPYPGIEERYVSAEQQWYFQVKYVTTVVTESSIAIDQVIGANPIASNRLRHKLVEAMHKNNGQGYAGNVAFAIKEAAFSLEKVLQNELKNLPEKQSSSSRTEYLRFWKTALHLAQTAIMRFRYDQLSPHLLAELKNTASRYLARKLRETALRISLSYTWESEDPTAAEDEIRDFYIPAVAGDSEAERREELPGTKILEHWWAEVRKSASGHLFISVSGVAAGRSGDLAQSVRQLITGRPRAHTLPRPMKSADDLRRFTADLRQEVSAMPPEVLLDRCRFTVPGGIATFMDTEIRYMEDALTSLLDATSSAEDRFEGAYSESDSRENESSDAAHGGSSGEPAHSMNDGNSAPLRLAEFAEEDGDHPAESMDPTALEIFGGGTSTSPIAPRIQPHLGATPNNTTGNIVGSGSKDTSEPIMGALHERLAAPDDLAANTADASPDADAITNSDAATSSALVGNHSQEHTRARTLTLSARREQRREAIAQHPEVERERVRRRMRQAFNRALERVNSLSGDELIEEILFREGILRMEDDHSKNHTPPDAAH